MSEETPDYDKSKVVRAIEGGDLDDLRDAVEGVPRMSAPASSTLKIRARGTPPAHHCAKRNAVDAAKLLLELGANPNAEDIKGRTCLHVACDAYREDETGDIALEDMIVALVDGGALSLECVQGKLPDPGDDAAGIVQKYLDRAFEAGAETRKNQKEARRAKRKEKMDAIFAGNSPRTSPTRPRAQSRSWTAATTTDINSGRETATDRRTPSRDTQTTPLDLRAWEFESAVYHTS